MKMSDRGLAELAGHEGIVLQPYKDSVGVWTIGVGHTAAAGAPDPAKSGAISLDEAMALFRRDVTKYEADVERAVEVPLQQHEFDALVSFHYNTGGIGRAKLTAALNAGDRASAAAGFAGWLQPPEVKPRRLAEQHLFRAGVYGNGGKATVYDARDGRVDWGSAKRIDVLALLDGAPVDDPAPPAAEPTPPEVSPEVLAALRAQQAALDALAGVLGVNPATLR